MALDGKNNSKLTPLAEFEAEGYSGKVLYQKIFDCLCKEGGCFARGTLVWTDQGLKPIEEIKIGDLVLSKPEDDDSAPTAYKRVIDTFSSEAGVACVDAYRPVLGAENDYEFSAVLATNEHPFWVNCENGGWQWLPAYRAAEKKLRLQDGSEVDVANSGGVRQWRDDKYQPVAGLGMDSLTPRFISYGRKIDCRGERPLIAPLNSDDGSISVDDAGNPEEELLLRVYNLTVEDYHTYFVGDWGFWVHH